MGTGHFTWGQCARCPVVPESAARIQNIKMRPGTLVSALPALLLLQLPPALLQRSPSTNTNTRLFTGNQALDSGALGFGLGSVLISLSRVCICLFSFNLNF